jgi:hypothetical protein
LDKRQTVGNCELFGKKVGRGKGLGEMKKGKSWGKSLGGRGRSTLWGGGLGARVGTVWGTIDFLILWANPGLKRGISMLE